MKALQSLFIVTVLAPSLAWAQAPSPAQVGLTSDSPNAVQIRDSSGTWTTIGTIDPTTHVFVPASGSGIIAGISSTNGFTAGQLLMSDGAKAQATGIMYTRGIDADVIYNELYGSSPTLSFGVNTYQYGYASTVGLPAGEPLAWWIDTNPNNLDTALFHTTPGILSQRNGTNTQAFRVYNSFTDDSNGLWAEMEWVTYSSSFPVLGIGPRSNGTGANAGIVLHSDWYGANISIDAAPGYIGLNDSAIEIGGRLDANANMNVTGTVSINGAAGVSCAAGTVSLTTFEVTDGIVTHC